MATPALMIQATGSNAGKSLVVAGLCRAFSQRGLAVRPFKPQNMSNNAAVTEDGGEIGRAQALQARACGVAPAIDMNPVLLKPETETGAQVIVQGERMVSLKARDYADLKPKLLEPVVESFSRLGQQADLVIVEGAGSPAEVNLRQGDIANMGFALAAHVPVILLGDIDRGGVIANLVGTYTLLPEEDRTLVKGFLINKFRGDPSLFEEGNRIIAERTGWPPLGIISWFKDAHRLPAEDVLGLSQIAEENASRDFSIAVLQFQRIANFDDLDPLRLHEGVAMTLVAPGQAIPGNVDLVILPGSKSTLSDLAFLRDQGWDVDLAAHIRRGGHVLGLCGGYQMLGRTLADPQGLEGAARSVEGLGHLDIETQMEPEKTLRAVTGLHVATNAYVSGYEMHLGRSSGADLVRPFLHLDALSVHRGPISDGAVSASGRVMGTYVHGLFAQDAFRIAFLNWLGMQNQATFTYEADVERTLDALAAHIADTVDLDQLYDIARKAPSYPD